MSLVDSWTQEGWNFQFRRNLNDWEIENVADFFRSFEDFKGIKNEYDKLWLCRDSKGTFKVNSAYKLLNQGEAVLTQENFNKRKFSMCSRCYLCGKEIESVNHLFLRCKITTQLWRIFISLGGSAWVMPNKIAHLYSWEEVGDCPACIWWTVWKERNSRYFGSKNCDLQKIKLNCIRLLCFWCKQMYLEDTESIIDILGTC
ncbi:unnamed protein product [Withania somnifera]